MNVPIARHPANVPMDQHPAAQVVTGLLVALAASTATVAPLLLRLWLATHDARIGVPLL